MYVVAVMLMLLWPSRSDTSFKVSPDSRPMVALECRKFFSGIAGRSTCRDSVSNRDDTVFGCHAVPSACVNTNPVSAQPGPMVSFCSACRRCQRRSAAAVSLSRAPARADCRVFGFDGRAFPPTVTIVVPGFDGIVTVPLARSMYSQRSPTSSPRRRPRQAITANATANGSFRLSQ